MPKYDVGDILQVEAPYDNSNACWYLFITQLKDDRYYYFYMDDGRADWSAVDGVDGSERISRYA